MTIFADNRALLEAYRRGDRAALAAVFARYVDEVATLARRGFTIESSGHTYVRGVDRDAELELVQETFAKVFVERARLAYDGVHPFRPYLLRVTKNLMIDRYRANQRTIVSGELEAGRDEPVELEDPDWQKQQVVTKAFLATLAPEIEQIVTLRFEDELSQDEVAARVGCSRRRVRTVEADVQNAICASS